MAGIRVVLETGRRRAFASAADWPGWCRSGRDEDDALAALEAYRGRYAAVARLAGVGFRPAPGYDVVDRTAGDATTEFGAPGRPAATDSESLTAAAARKQVALLRAAWAELDRLAGEAPASLRKGPRGGGRDRDAVVAHVVAAEQSYARKVGVRHPPPGDAAAIEALRTDLAAALARGSDGTVLAEKGWSARYALRRITWHVLDHVWEIEDRSGPAG